MKNKEILASLEITNHEIRLIVGEFHNNKLNVLHVEQVAVTGIENFVIQDESQVISAISKAASNASKLIGVKIEKVLLAIPPVHFQKRTRRATVFTETAKRKIEVDAVRETLKKTIATAVDGHLELVNSVIVRFIADGAISTKLPKNESCYELAIEVDLLCANRELVYEYVKCVEQAKLEVIDIAIDMYAIAKETALFEQAAQPYTLLVKIERDATILSLITHGRLMSCEVLPEGINKIIFRAMDQFKLPYDIMTRLIRYNCHYDTINLQDSPIFMWSVDDQPKTVSETDVVNATKPYLVQYIEYLKDACEAILETGKVAVVLCGEGAEIMGVKELIGKEFEVTTKAYVPETLGARNSALTACLGMMYVYKDLAEYRKFFVNSVDVIKFEQHILAKRKKETVMEDSVTNKFRNIFEKKKAT